MHPINATNQCKPCSQKKKTDISFWTKNQCNQSMQTITAPNQCNQSMQTMYPENKNSTSRFGPKNNATNQCKQSMQAIQATNQCKPCTQKNKLYISFWTKNQCNQSMQTINARNQCTQSMQPMNAMNAYPQKKNIHHVFDPKTAIIPKIMRNHVFDQENNQNPKKNIRYPVFDQKSSKNQTVHTYIQCIYSISQ